MSSRAFERVTGMTVTLGLDSIGIIQSPGVTGSLTAEQALRALVVGTSVRFRLTSSTTAVLELAAAGESVDVDRPRAATVVARRRSTRSRCATSRRRSSSFRSRCCRIRRATSLRDALRNTPGITLTAGEGGTAPGDNLLIRGFSARNDVYIDGARDPGVVSRDTFNTEAVEVAKGPSSVTAGRGSTGGSVNLVTKAANLRDSAEVRLCRRQRQPETQHARRQSPPERDHRGASQRHVAGLRRARPRRRRRRRAGASRRRSASASASRRR